LILIISKNLILLDTLSLHSAVMRQFLQHSQSVAPPIPSDEQEQVVRSPQEDAAHKPEAPELTPSTEPAESTESAHRRIPEHDFSQIPMHQPDRLGTPLELTASVGKNGENAPEDVARVQARLNQLEFEAGEIDGQYRDQLADAIHVFQEFFLQEPDSLIEVGSESHLRLNQVQSAAAAKTPEPKNEETSVDETDEQLLQAQPQFKVKWHKEFVQSLDGKMIDSKLMETLEAFFHYLIAHHHVDDDIVLLEGMRDARKSHRWSTAYAIRNDQIPLETVKKLPGGRDADGNRWYVEGDTPAQIRRRAADLGLNSPSTPAAEGYSKGDGKQFPNEWNDGISNHLIGKAVKVLIPWTTPKAGQLIDPIANDIIQKFGLKRPVPKDETHFELLHGSPKGDEEHGHRDSET
jgi:peptidoglycan hydrolase-like protein with peptidoglycan-binding domain